MEVAAIPKRVRRRSIKKTTGPGPGVAELDDNDDEIAELIARARRLRDRMLLATSGMPDLSMTGPSTALELDVLSNVMGDSDDIDTDSLFANLFFGTEGAEAVSTARHQRVDDSKNAEAMNRIADQIHNDASKTLFCLHLVKINFDRNFPFTTSTPSIKVTFTLPSQPSKPMTEAKITGPLSIRQRKRSMKIDQKFSFLLSSLIFEPQCFQFTVTCDCLSTGTRPSLTSMTGFLSLNGLNNTDSNGISRDLDLISRDRRYRCTLSLKISSESPTLSAEPEDLKPTFNSPDLHEDNDGIHHVDEPSVKPTYKQQNMMPNSPMLKQSFSSEPIEKLEQSSKPSLGVRTGDLVVIQIGIRTAVVTATDRLRYVFVAYQAFPDQARARTSPRPERYCQQFNHIGQMARLFSDQLYEQLKSAKLILEVWTCASPRPQPGTPSRFARILGIAKIRLNHLLPCLRAGTFNKNIEGGNDVVSSVHLCGFNDGIEIRDVISGNVVGRLSVTLALGSLPQMVFLADLWRSAVPIQRIVRGFLCRRRLPNRVCSPITDINTDYSKSKLDHHGDVIKTLAKEDGKLVSKDTNPDPGIASVDSTPADIVTVRKPFLDGLEIGCDRAANLTDPKLSLGSLYVQFNLDPVPKLSHQSGRGSTHLVPGCSHPIWSHHILLNLEVLPDPDQLAHSDIVFALQLRVLSSTDRCLGRARIRLQILASKLLQIDEAEVVEWLDLIHEDNRQCMGQLQVRIAVGSAVRDALQKAHVGSYVHLQPLISAPLISSLRFPLSSSQPLVPISPSLEDSLDCIPVSDRLDCKNKVITTSLPTYLGPPLTMADVDRQLEELEQVKSRLLDQFEKGRHRVPVIFTPHPPSGPLPAVRTEIPESVGVKSDLVESVSNVLPTESRTVPEDTIAPLKFSITLAETSQKPGATVAGDIIDISMGFSPSEEKPAASISADADTQANETVSFNLTLIESSDPLCSDSSLADGMNNLISKQILLDEPSNTHSIEAICSHTEIEPGPSKDLDASSRTSSNQIRSLSVALTCQVDDMPIKPVNSIGVTTAVADNYTDSTSIKLDDQFDPLPAIGSHNTDTSVGFPATQIDSSSAVPFDRDNEPPSVIDLAAASPNQIDSTTATSMEEIGSPSSDSSHHLDSDDPTHIGTLPFGIVNTHPSGHFYTPQVMSVDEHSISSMANSVDIPHSPPMTSINTSSENAPKSANFSSHFDNLSSPIDAGDDDHHIDHPQPKSQNSSPKSHHDVALSPIHATVNVDHTYVQHSLPSPEQPQSLQNNSFQVRHRTPVSYTSSPGLSSSSRESSPIPFSDSESDDTLSRTSSGPSRSLPSPRRLPRPKATMNCLPPLPPKPRSHPAQMRLSADDRKRYERISRIFQGGF